MEGRHKQSGSAFCSCFLWGPKFKDAEPNPGSANKEPGATLDDLPDAKRKKKKDYWKNSHTRSFKYWQWCFPAIKAELIIERHTQANIYYLVHTRKNLLAPSLNLRWLFMKNYKERSSTKTVF